MDLNFINMKVTFLLACISVVLSSNRVYAAAVEAPLDLITLEDLTPSDRKQLEYLNEREKRSGSSDIFSSIKNAIGQGIKKKIGQIAHSSASASGHFSSSSSGGGGGYHHEPEVHDHKSFDFWSLKKSILNTLLQAVKAIKGGVIAIKGQLIKGSGYLISAKGKLISTKGEAITNLGKNIASSAILIPHGHTGHTYAVAEYGHGHGHSEHYEHPTGHHDYHGSPSAPGPEYETPDSYNSPHHDETHNGHSGILVLKKIPHGGRDHSSSYSSSVPSFKPIEASGPSFATIFGKFFKASTSLDPHAPEGFGDTAPVSHHSEDTHIYHDSEDSHEYDSHEYSKEPSNVDIKEHSSNHGTPFEEEPQFLKEYSAATKNRPVVVKHPNSLLTPPSETSSKDQSKFVGSAESLEELKAPEPTQQSLYTSMNLLALNVDELPNIESFPPYPGELPPEFIAKYGRPSSTKQSFVHNQFKNSFLPTPLDGNIPSTASTYFRQKNRPNNVRHTNINRPLQTTLTNQPFTADIVRSVSFELGPNGPKRLT